MVKRHIAKFNIERWIADLASQEARRWFKEQGKDLGASFYLYYTRGGIRIATDVPGPGWALATHVKIGADWSIPRAVYFVTDTLRRCPCLPLQPPPDDGLPGTGLNR